MGQAISTLGSSFTAFAIPLLVYKLTHSALYLGVAWAASYVPNLLFGLVIGAWMDRVDRRKVMIRIDLASALLVLSIPLLAVFDALQADWLYVATFFLAVLFIAFSAGEFAALPRLVPKDDLLAANSRIYASNAAATVAGPVLAGLMLTFAPVQWALAVDGASYFISAAFLASIRKSFNAPGGASAPTASTLREDIRGGLRYVLKHPVLRNIALMLALINFFNAVTWAQIVLFAKVHFAASDRQVSFFWAASGAGVLALSLSAGWLRKRLSFGTVVLGALVVDGAASIALALTHVYALGLALWALHTGLVILVTINTNSFRQQVVPPNLLARVITVSNVVAWSAIPLGALAGGAVISATGRVALIYGLIGAIVMTIAILFYALTPLGRAEPALREDSGLGNGQ